MNEHKTERSTPIQELRLIEEREIIPKCHVRFIHSDNVTLSYWNLEQGAVLPSHSHPHEQVCNVIKGRMDLTLGDETLHLTQGMVVVIPPNVPHSAKAHEPCYVIDVFYPIREDYRRSESSVTGDQ